MKLARWEKILSQLKVTGAVKPLCREQDLLDFAARASIILPESYQEFCLTFGPGEISDWFRFYCPVSSDLPHYARELCDLELHSKLVLGFQKEAFDFDQRSETKDKFRSGNNHLNDSLIFASTKGGADILWDLDSYQLKDKSYDIYILEHGDSFEKRTKVGRDFYKFIKNFCLGAEAAKYNPEIYRETDNEKRMAFVRFDIYEYISTYSRLQYIENMGFFQQIGYLLDSLLNKKF